MLERQDTEELTEEDLNREIQQECLQRLRSFLCDYLEPERFFPFLQSKEYLDTDSCEQIRNAGTTRNRVNKMLDILIKSGPRPLEALTKAIKKSGTTQKFIIKRLLSEYEKIQQEQKNIDRWHAIHSYPQGGNCGILPPPYTPLPPYHNDLHNSFTVQSDSQYHGEIIAPSQFPSSPSTLGQGKMSQQYSRSKSQELSPNATKQTDILERSVSDGVGNIQRRKSPILLHPAFNSRSNLMADVGKTPFNTVQMSGMKSTPTDAPQSPFDENPSHFQTSDFFPSDHLSTMNEIITTQIEEERKLSLHHVKNEESQILTCQREKFSKYEATNRSAHSVATQRKWIRSSRIPSEHDSSITPTRPNASECGDDSQTYLKDMQGASLATNEQYGTGNPPRNVMTIQSCQNGSIQPSCFTSSSFEEFHSHGSNVQLGSKGDRSPIRKTSESSPSHRVRSPGIKSPTIYASSLETIPSIETPPSMELLSTCETPSIKIRRPPTEHEDSSIVNSSPACDEESDSSLEISTDSEI